MEKRKKIMVVAVSLIIVFSLISLYLFLPGEEEIIEPPPINRRDIGAGDDNFWVLYPTNHTSSGEVVDHSQWILDELETKVVVMLIHKEGCTACIPLKQTCENIYNNRSDIVCFSDLNYDLEIEKAWTSFNTYDPTGNPYALPLSGVFTKVHNPNGADSIAWHSWIGAVEDSEFTSWVNDAISYHNETK